ncbi:hypothetical protein [Bacillus phage SPO1L3]|nr:hypothetical protein Goe9_c00010 [Bacillus phage vB_BsuM-Goe9]QMV48504.1 hypothetical protein Goe9_c02010 [Bacillus phage vB_BsuM-Goe9]QMV48532.1 hypothetical protein Goe10_c00010 [Bacillus phage vB_BsuM-Goe10]QMV48727.1 hypothetical protein Goe10_c01990 [Bacillus phage vB_BsuM-Goe10]WIT26334.1 hypothetical protein [Bacillus phage SPO1L3]
MKKPSIFNIRAYKEYRSNMSKDEVDMAFTGAQDDTTPKCYVCTNNAHYEIFHKQDDATIPDIPNRGFICEHCKKQKYLDVTQYNLRKLEGIIYEGPEARDS